MANGKNVFFDITLPVSLLREGKFFVAYTPALDLSTSGKSFEELLEKCTLEKVLSELGWYKVENKWTPPMPISQELENFRIPSYN